MPWCGYNYEDSILISEKAVKDDTFTSVHIEEFEVVARDTKLGPEEITRDIPNVGEEMLKDLDDCGIIRIGARVVPDDILVGKITPKGETQLTPEEKLLRAIFGDKARDVKNTSLKVPPGIEGTVIDVRVFNRRSGEKDDRTKSIEDFELARIDIKEAQHIEAIAKNVRRRVWDIVAGKTVVQTLKGKKKNEVILEANHPMRADVLEELPVKKLAGLFTSKDTNEAVAEVLDEYDRHVHFVKEVYDQKRGKVTEGDDLPPGVIKMVKVYVAVKRKLNVGDKMAGRHGNKGVVSCILPIEDMAGTKATVILCDRLKGLGYEYATRAGVSIGVKDLTIPSRKASILDAAQNEVDNIELQYGEGIITRTEKYNKVVDVWTKATNDIASEMMKEISWDILKDPKTGREERNTSVNPIFMMIHSGARGNQDQMRQLAGMRGLMAKPSGEIIETPITSNFREGLSVTQYFNSTHGARKGLADTALKTANSGYLTRRLVDVVQDVIVTEIDCGTVDGLEISHYVKAGDIKQRVHERALGRVTMLSQANSLPKMALSLIQGS